MKNLKENILNNIESLPNHLAIIMDGNGRWAKNKFMPRVKGHVKGVERAKETIDACLELNIPYLSLYAFSKENWKRPKDEVSFLMRLFKRHIISQGSELFEKGVKFKVIGDRDDLSKDLRKTIEDVENLTKDCTNMTLQLCISYSGRDDILKSVKKIANLVKEGLDVNDISEDLISDNLLTKNVPDPDLLIRTSGEKRISNFFLWQIAYSEIVISETLWPDFKEDDLYNAFSDYLTRERRFGKTTEQVTNKKAL